MRVSLLLFAFLFSYPAFAHSPALEEIPPNVWLPGSASGVSVKVADSLQQSRSIVEIVRESLSNIEECKSYNQTGYDYTSVIPGSSEIFIGQDKESIIEILRRDGQFRRKFRKVLVDRITGRQESRFSHWEALSWQFDEQNEGAIVHRGFMRLSSNEKDSEDQLLQKYIDAGIVREIPRYKSGGVDTGYPLSCSIIVESFTILPLDGPFHALVSSTPNRVNQRSYRFENCTGQIQEHAETFFIEASLTRRIKLTRTATSSTSTTTLKSITRNRSSSSTVGASLSASYKGITGSISGSRQDSRSQSITESVSRTVAFEFSASEENEQIEVFGHRDSVSRTFSVQPSKVLEISLVQSVVLNRYELSGSLIFDGRVHRNLPENASTLECERDKAAFSVVNNQCQARLSDLLDGRTREFDLRGFVEVENAVSLDIQYRETEADCK